jgi:hypothetical protein
MSVNRWRKQGRTRTRFATGGSLHVYTIKINTIWKYISIFGIFTFSYNCVCFVPLLSDLPYFASYILRNLESYARSIWNIHVFLFFIPTECWCDPLSREAHYRYRIYFHSIHKFSIDTSSSSFIHLSIALQLFVGPWPLLQFRNTFLHGR